MPNDTKQFNDIAKTLRDELSLISDDDPKTKTERLTPFFVVLCFRAVLSFFLSLHRDIADR